ncbi:hypothetical protein B0T42_12575 [Rathayibacter sp. VKM Ac-2630]|nr:hypothetical protein B0T42_12575 [Rathayibacter sp. VKM Ac-2630]
MRRRAAGLSAQKLADMLPPKITRSVIANIECGNKKDVSVADVAALARALGVPFFELAPEADVDLRDEAYRAGYEQAVADMRAFSKQDLYG